jgi:L-lactate dehydrogenase complex protein LldG
LDRSAFLQRVRSGLRETQAVGLLPAELPPTFATGDGRLFDRFAAELEAAGGEAIRVTRDDLVEALAVRTAGCGTAVVAPNVDHLEAVIKGLARAGCEILEPDRDGAARADLGVTGAALGVAATGSVLLSSGPGSPRTAGLLPPSHLVVLPEERLVPGFEELFERMPALSVSSSQLVLVTGPSRTSDIEMTLVRGVHGPEDVTVLVVSA